MGCSCEIEKKGVLTEGVGLAIILESMDFCLIWSLILGVTLDK